MFMLTEKNFYKKFCLNVVELSILFALFSQR
jgi:hypothetical protein